MTPRLTGQKQQDIDDRLREHGLDPATFAIREQASECITHYIRPPGRALGTNVPAAALALYPRDREDLYMTFEHDPHIGFRSSFRPALRFEVSTSVLTWEALMGILDQWLELLIQEEVFHGSMRAYKRSGCISETTRRRRRSAER
jgi:hypothetical protein